MGNKRELLRAVRSGDAEAVRRNYSAEHHREAIDAAAAARQWRMQAMLEELAPPTATKSGAKVVVKSASQHVGEHVELDAAKLVRAFTHAQDALATTHVDMSLYRALPTRVEIARLRIEHWAQRMREAIVALPESARHSLDADVLADDQQFTVERRHELDVESNRIAVVRDADTHEIVTERSDALSYAYTAAGDRGPVVVFVHGVPTNREQWWPVQRLMSRWCRTLSIDLLGMGESSQPLDMPDAAWDWRYDAVSWSLVLERLVRSGRENVWGQAPRTDERILLVADDWGAGPAQHFAELYGREWLLGCALLDPIALDGYPVAEIQAFGRLHQIADEDAFRAAVGAADQTMVQIFKTMVDNAGGRYNQYALRSLKKTYADVDYERAGASSLTLRLNYHALRVMAARSARLSPEQLLPYERSLNPHGVDFQAVHCACLLMWGERDSMMPEAQLHRLRLLLINARSVHTHSIAAAGHFAATDQPLDVATELLKFAASRVGMGAHWRPPSSRDLDAAQPALADVFVGLKGIWKGDERRLLDDLRKLYGVEGDGE